MISLKQIDNYIIKLITHLKQIQNKDGSFDTMCLQPYFCPGKGWFNFTNNAPYDTATTLIPLFNINNQEAQEIIENAIRFIKKNCYYNKLWTYAYLSDEYKIPFDTDSTSLCSYVLSKKKISIDNKAFLNSLINKHNNYPFYIWPRKFSKQLSFFENVKLFLRNKKIKKLKPILQDDMRIDDWEFSSSCVNLLYLGKSKENESVWKFVHSTFQSQSIDYLYYIDTFHSTYLYSRLLHYGKHEIKYSKEFLKRMFADLVKKINHENCNFKRVLLVNSFLFFNYPDKELNNLIEQIFDSIKNESYKKNSAFYSSNVKTDAQPKTNIPNTYFGSPGITCSLYLEFLNTYRERIHDSYYGFNS